MAGEIKWNSWRDRLKEASFRGVKFRVLSTTTEGGRRSVLHQYPFADEPYWEDMGKEAGTYQVQAYIVSNFGNGFDYFKERDDLIYALTLEGPGQLIHPFLGSKLVGVLGKYKLDENAVTDGGTARFTITFVDAGRAVQPSALLSDEGAVADACDEVDAEIIVPSQSTLEQLLDDANAAAEAVDGVINTLNTVYSTLLSVQSDVTGAISAAQTRLADIRGTIQDLVEFPEQFADAVKNVLDTYDNLGLSVKSGDTTVVEAALGLVDADGVTTTFPVTTPSRELQLEARNWATEAMKAGGLSQAVRLAVGVQYVSYDEVKTMLDRLIAAIDSVTDHIGSNSKNDSLTATVAALKPLVTNNLIAKGANLPAVRTEVLAGDPQPAVVLARRIYGDITREQELIDMNPVALRHPGFPEAGATISVLSE